MLLSVVTHRSFQTLKSFSSLTSHRLFLSSSRDPLRSIGSFSAFSSLVSSSQPHNESFLLSSQLPSQQRTFTTSHDDPLHPELQQELEERVQKKKILSNYGGGVITLEKKKGRGRGSKEARLLKREAKTQLSQEKLEKKRASLSKRGSPLDNDDLVDHLSEMKPSLFDKFGRPRTCLGCGSFFQVRDSSLPGYVPPLVMARAIKGQKEQLREEKEKGLKKKEESEGQEGQKMDLFGEESVKDIVFEEEQEKMMRKTLGDFDQKDVDAFHSSIREIKESLSSGPQIVPRHLSLDPSSSSSVLICKRCHRLKHNNEPPPPGTIPNPPYIESVLQGVTRRPSLIILIVDMFDISGSVFPEISSLISQGHEVIVVGNKIDLYPVREERDLEKVRIWLKHYVQTKGIEPSKVILSSTRSNYGIRTLANTITKKRYHRDVILIGSVSSGKSAIINRLVPIMGDSLKDQVSVLTSSPLPGTTMRPVPIRFASGEKMIDTPGVVVGGHIYGGLTVPELMRVVPAKKMKPQKYRLTAGKTIFLGGLGRIDIVECPMAVLTVYVSSHIKVHCTSIDKADSIYEKHIGKILTPPYHDGLPPHKRPSLSKRKKERRKKVLSHVTEKEFNRLGERGREKLDRLLREMAEEEDRMERGDEAGRLEDEKEQVELIGAGEDFDLDTEINEEEEEDDLDLEELVGEEGEEEEEEEEEGEEEEEEEEDGEEEEEEEEEEDEEEEEGEEEEEEEEFQEIELRKEIIELIEKEKQEIRMGPVNKDRLKSFPPLVGFDITTEEPPTPKRSRDVWTSPFTDVVFSGIGWISIASATSLSMRVYSPKGTGIFLREPIVPSTKLTRKTKKKMKRKEQIHQHGKITNPPPLPKADIPFELSLPK